MQVLLVERHTDLSEMVATVIQQCGHQAQQVKSGLDAIRSAVAQLPDIVVTSMHLPDCKGDELAGRLRSDPRTAAIVTVLLTGETVSRLPPESTRVFDHLIQKPFRVEEFIELLSFYAASAGGAVVPQTDRFFDMPATHKLKT